MSALLDPVTGGGTAERTAQLARAMTRFGMEVTVLGTDAGLLDGRVPDVGAARLEIAPIASRRFLVPWLRKRQLERWVEQADVVHLCNHWTLLNLLVRRAARRVGKPYAVCPAGALPIFGRSRWLKHAYNAVGGRSLIHEAAACVAITPRETEDFRAYGVDPAGVEVIPNGIEPGDYVLGDAEAFRAQHGLGARKLILFMGRLNSIKGPDLLLEAFAREAKTLDDYALVFAGPDGGMRASLEQRAVAAGIAERVRFVGWLGGADKIAAYRAADLVAIPSRSEAMSLVVLEAGVCAKSVLMTDRCGFDKAVAAGAVLAVAPDTASLASGLLELSTRPGDRGARLRDLVLAHYTWDEAVRRYARVFSRIVGG